ncbi:MAG: hypothetical protein WCG83_07000 [Candidatus Peregrinibacteria bacterium]
MINEVPEGDLAKRPVDPHNLTGNQKHANGLSEDVRKNFAETIAL